MRIGQASGEADFAQAPIDIDREGYLGLILKNMSNTLEETVGRSEAHGFINLVGLAVSEEIQDEYLRAAGTKRLDRAGVTAVILDLKRRMGGDFYVLEESDNQIVLGNRRCPFGDLARDCPSLCMMTSHVFGHLVAESQGYGRVTLADTIARGGQGCRIVIDLDPDAPDKGGQSYYARGDA